MATLEKALKILEGLSPEKLDIAVYILESLAVKQKFESMNIEELTPEEAHIVDIALKELENGSGVEAEYVWREAGI
jgi:hypothetical protein